jgi:hypothetical protein
MFRGIITAFFAGAIAAGFSSTAYAKPRVQSQSQSPYTTRSGTSLRGLENRSVSRDFPTFLPETSERSPNSVPAPISLQDNPDTVNQLQSITVFGQKIELGHRDSSQNSENQAPSHVGLRNVEVSAGASSLDSQQLFKVQYQMLSSPEQK